MNILFSESSLNLGGQELQILQQMTALQKQGIAVTLLAQSVSRIYQKAVRLGLPVFPVPFRNSLHLPSFFKVLSAISKTKANYLITHSGKDANVCGLAARLSKRRPTVIRVRTYQAGFPKTFTYNWLADLTLVPSKLMRGQIVRNPKIKKERIQLLYPGIDFEKIKSQSDLPLAKPLADWLTAHPGKIISHVAMLRPEKGHLFMLKVIRDLLHDFPTLRYVVAGEGQETYKNLIKESIYSLGLTEHVFLAGLLDVIAPLLKKTDLLVMPSLQEPLGMSQSEALSLGVPVMGSDVDGIPETIAHQKTGLLAKPGNMPDWCAGVRFALHNPEKMLEMAQAGQADVMERFPLQTNIDSFLKYLKEAKAT
jgi:glycosyltransferase involved in cell wall biosynthesis